MYVAETLRLLLCTNCLPVVLEDLSKVLAVIGSCLQEPKGENKVIPIVIWEEFQEWLKTCFARAY